MIFNKRRPLVVIAVLLASAATFAAINYQSGPGDIVTPATGNTVQQTLTLQPGWNAVYLQVKPADPEPEAVFSGIPIVSVWTPNLRVAPPQFVSDVSEPKLAQAGWLRYFPSTNPESFLTNLYSIRGNKAYLINLGGTAPVAWTVTGTPALKKFEWVPDGFTLTGFPVNPTAPPAFSSFFAGSSAHLGQTNYRLDASGQWVPALAADPIQDGAAYWIYTKGGSEYQGPFEIILEDAHGLEFGPDLEERQVVLQNNTSQDKTITFEQHASGSPVPLLYWQFVKENPSIHGDLWSTLPTPYSVTLPAGQTVAVRLSVRRSLLAADEVNSLLEIRDAAGIRCYFTLQAAKLLSPAQQTFAANKKTLAGRIRNLISAPTTDYPGLWTGIVRVDKVSFPQDSNDPNTPRTAGSPAQFRILLHIDAAGNVRLLKQVIQMWKDGTTIPDPQDPNFQIVGQPGEYVLLTDDTLIPSFSGSSLRDGEAVGRRLSSIAYDFADTPGEPPNTLPLTVSGGIGTSGSVSGTILLDLDAATNPFKHKYHPDHDNLNAQYSGPLAESYTVARQFTLQFAASDPFSGAAAVPPSWGTTTLGGVYQETVTGLHRRPIQLEGVFRLQRLSVIDQLNPTP